MYLKEYLLEQYAGKIYDINCIQKPKEIDTIFVFADNRSNAMDLIHAEADDKYPTIKKMIQIFTIGDVF